MADKPDRNALANEQYEARLAQTSVLEPSGDSEHDAYTTQVHELDALSPRRFSFVDEHYTSLEEEAEAEEPKPKAAKKSAKK